MNGMQEMGNRIVSLLRKCFNKEELKGEEKIELDTWLAQSHNRLLLEEMMNEPFLREEVKQYMEPDEATMFLKLAQKRAAQHQGAKLASLTGRHWWRYAAAAVLFILFSSAAYFIFFNPKAKQDMATTGPVEKRFNNDVAPGTEKAILTLADGTTIVLDSLSNGAIAQQGNTVIMKEDGLLAYNADHKNLSTAILYNTITVPRGGEYRSLVLADGTKVWLNAFSSMRFPTAFTAKERIVEITGEVYFEVAKNPSRPFRVFVAPPPAGGGGGGMRVEVLGTHFNVNAYSDEAVIKTTLLEGSVKIVNGKSLALIKPGQQAQVPNAASGDGNIKVINDADVDAEVAWKNGLLVFNQADIKVILRQISRWYDVDVEYKGDIRVPKFYGEIPRTVTLSEVLKIIEINSKLQFTIEGKKVTVKQP